MSIDLSGPPYSQIILADKKAFAQFAYKLNYEKGKEFGVRVVRGHKMRSLNDLFDEFSAAFQFPDYFGENWDALDECLADLEWIPATAGYVLLVANTAEVLREENHGQFEIFIKVLSRACEEWAGGKHSKRFFAFFHCTDGELGFLQQRFQRANLAVPEAHRLT